MIERVSLRLKSFEEFLFGLQVPFEDLAQANFQEDSLLRENQKLDLEFLVTFAGFWSMFLGWERDLEKSFDRLQRINGSDTQWLAQDAMPTELQSFF